MFKRSVGFLVLMCIMVACGSQADMVEVTRDKEVEVKEPAGVVATQVVEKEVVVTAAATRAAESGSAMVATPSPAPTFAPEFVVEEGEADRAEEKSKREERPLEPLTAGEIDDNEMFQKYLDYVRRYDGPAVYALDVNERHIISVRDAKGLPVLDAHVTAFADGQLVFEGRTTASGQVLLHPRALGVQSGTTLALRVQKDAAVNEVNLISGQSDHHVVELDHGGRADVPVPLDILFLIDATGSMDDEIAKLKASILEISAEIDALPARPDVHFGMVTYRDRGDAYITRIHDFTSDVRIFQAELEDVRAQGGGDYPESLNEALHRALWDVAWRDEEAVRLIFLVADAPPHLDYEQDYAYDQEMVEAVRRGIKVNSLASSGLDDQGEYVFRQLAQFTLGRFLFLTYEEAGQPGSGPGEETEHHVEAQDYTVDLLDTLIVRLVTEELAVLSDASIRYAEP